MEKEVRFFSALSSEPRIRLLLLLKEHPQCVNGLVQRLKMTQSAVSQHLRVLKAASLVKAKKNGYWVHYELNRKELEARGRNMGKLFGGWVNPTTGSGIDNCPPELLRECGGAPKKGKTGRSARSTAKE
jgi:DNA-binding transcriptional ArsR family regulator